jgi:hypothetical protein
MFQLVKIHIFKEIPMENDNKEINEENSKFDIENNKVTTNMDNIEKKNVVENSKIEESKKGKKVQKPKKPKTVKQIIISRIIFVIIFLAIVAGITYYFINSEKNIESSVGDNIATTVQSTSKSSNYSSVDLNGMYYTNPIKITTVKEDMDRVPEGFKYLKIDGLKNETIEEKINAYIKDNFKNYLKNLMDKTDESVTYEVYVGTKGNFANIISVVIDISESIGEIDSEGYEYNHYAHYCNLNLIDGEEIDLGKDVFESESAASNFLLGTLYNQLIQEYTEMDEETYELYPAEDSKYVEENVYEIVSNYQRGKNFEFGITPSALVCVTGDEYAISQDLYFSDYAKKLIIYDRYSTDKELYDGKYEKYGPFYNLTYEENCIDKNIEQTDKYYINTTLQGYFNEGEDIDSTALRVIKKIINEDIDRKKELANEYNYLVSNIIYIVSNRYSGDSYDGYNLGVTECSVNAYNRNYFENQILPVCLNYMRTMQNIDGGIGFSMWLDVAVNYAEPDYYYIEIDSDGNIVSDTRTVRYNDDTTEVTEQDPWLTVD